ncbi:MAG: type IV pilus assembly protein PilM [Fimbriimonadaceae bacterium]|nr:type IV pilus assembly protein PilM [Fimbriimonadaceae bacterium]QYK56002.1 MAG: type IV pilus assembly protein PilM [Fimbriimonadaceae bacterium]
MSLKLFRAKSYVGLDLGAKSIKAVQVERAAHGWKVTRFAHAPTPEDCIKDGVVTDVQAMAATIHAALRDAKISATTAVVGAAGASVIVRSVRTQKMPENVLRKSIKFEAGRYVPSSVEDSYIEFEILGETEDGQMEILVVAAPKEVVESRVKACEGAGLEVETVDVDAFAAYRVMVEAAPGDDLFGQTIALVDVGSQTTNVSVVSEGVFAMTRTIPQAGQIFTEALKNYFKLPEEDAEAGKAQLDLQSLLDAEKPQENPPLRVIQPHLDDLVREIRRSLNYYQSQQTEAGQNKPVTKILVCGGGASMKGLSTYMQNKLGLETLCLGVFDNPRFMYSGPDDPGHGFDLTVASGLAMRPFAKAA